jgi:hypothetical protein
MEETHWNNKLWIGKGTLNQFSEDYDKINAGTMQFATASQLFPTGLKSFEGELLFEYLIYYKVHPTALKMLDKSTGIVVDMTEKEGREIDPELNKVELVI